MYFYSIYKLITYILKYQAKFTWLVSVLVKFYTNKILFSCKRKQPDI